ncbi:E3 ubiquitin-protein ligase RNF19B-like protein [Sarcoptes scabiei]|uniref:RBR-type E3 ubiquitin transferase n=1 Tax=Sarcoptes scabiei TaxID=52283 RepID=A0A132A6U4_SARSC|nr:E3 ubiquitin-protein ligase RNF19B-like protein [Sarcoptes scabiei]
MKNHNDQQSNLLMRSSASIPSAESNNRSSSPTTNINSKLVSKNSSNLTPFNNQSSQSISNFNANYGTSNPTTIISTSAVSTTAVMTTPTPNKKHNLGFRLRRLFFGSNALSNIANNVPNISSSSNSSRSKAFKESERSEKKNSSQYSSSSHVLNDSSNIHNQRQKNPKYAHQSDLIRKKKSSTLQSSQANNNDNQIANNTSLCKNSDKNSYECSICLLEQPINQFPELKSCQHRACLSCLRQYLRIEISESRINISCLQCQELMHPNDIKTILRNDLALVEKYELFMVRRTLITDPDARWCPAPDCDYCVIATGCASCPMLRCHRPGCETLFCYHCKQEWHPNQTCDQARASRGEIVDGGAHKSVFIASSNPNKSNVTFTSLSSNTGASAFNQPPSSSSMNSFVQRDDIKPCPCCKVLIIKMNDGSCNHMTCSVCGTEFCWLCMQKISDLHYLSPSGCTFWGKKPWSRKKKIMWQLGMLVGAPVGIALIAGIAVPAIIIGIPVWVGRKLYSRFERNHMSRHKSNFLVTASVLTSILVSPILAAVTVGIGVPILLAYVYGVVPISLCRSGGCGVTTSSSGVRIELDEDEIPAPDGVSVDTALSGRGGGVTNPSIGEVSLGMSASLSIGSSSHLDKAVLDIQPDRETASMAACAGSIISEQTNQTGGQKLETLVDINSNKRYSFSSQNADSTSITLSIGDRSLNNHPQFSITSANYRSWMEPPNQFQSNSHFTYYSNQLSVSPVEVHAINNDTNKTIDDQLSSTTKLKTNSESVANQYKGKSRFPVITSNHNHLILNKFESRSMEYLSNNNYCNICYKSHKPCCPNFHQNLNQQNESITAILHQHQPFDLKPMPNHKETVNLFSEKSDTSLNQPRESEISCKTDPIKSENTALFFSKNGSNEMDRPQMHDYHSIERSTLKRKAKSQIIYPTTAMINENGSFVQDDQLRSMISKRKERIDGNNKGLYQIINDENIRRTSGKKNRPILSHSRSFNTNFQSIIDQ